MPTLLLTYSGASKKLRCTTGEILGSVIREPDFPFEMPCAGRGTCGKCKVIADGGLAPPDETEQKHLLPAEQAGNVRLACRATVVEDARVTLIPVVLYSNKVFTSSTAFRTNDDPLGLAVDLGSTTVAVFLASLRTGAVYAAGATLNQQTVFGADVISRLAVAEQQRTKLAALAQASIYQAIQSLRLSPRVSARIERVVIVGNSAMHHLLMQMPTHTLAAIPFQPLRREAICDGGRLLEGLFGPSTRVLLPPLIGGFVGSDTTACLAYFGFGRATQPLLAVDLGTNGEVMATDGRGQIVVASTAAGPAFEGMNISCGMRATDGAICDAAVANGELQLTTIGNCPAVGVTGTGLLSLVFALRKMGALSSSGRLLQDGCGVSRIRVSEGVTLTQADVRELQKAKAAVRAAADIALERLSIGARALNRMILAGSFGGQLNIDAALGLGLLPNVERSRIEPIANGAGLGAAMFLSDEGLRVGEALALQAQHVELDLDPEFNSRFVQAMAL